MNKLVLKNFEELRDNMYLGSMTIKDYKYLVNEGFIETQLNNDNIIYIMQEKANEYNNDENISSADIGIINLYIDKNWYNRIEKDNNNLIVGFDNIYILDGETRTIFVKYLNAKFNNNNILIQLHYCTSEERQQLLTQKNKEKM